jgi:hypothetical protein
VEQDECSAELSFSCNNLLVTAVGVTGVSVLELQTNWLCILNSIERARLVARRSLAPVPWKSVFWICPHTGVIYDTTID